MKIHLKRVKKDKTVVEELRKLIGACWKRLITQYDYREGKHPSLVFIVRSSIPDPYRRSKGVVDLAFTFVYPGEWKYSPHIYYDPANIVSDIRDPGLSIMDLLPLRKQNLISIREKKTKKDGKGIIRRDEKRGGDVRR